MLPVGLDLLAFPCVQFALFDPINSKKCEEQTY